MATKKEEITLGLNDQAASTVFGRLLNGLEAAEFPEKGLTPNAFFEACIVIEARRNALRTFIGSAVKGGTTHLKTRKTKEQMRKMLNAVIKLAGVEADLSQKPGKARTALMLSLDDNGDLKAGAVRVKASKSPVDGTEVQVTPKAKKGGKKVEAPEVESGDFQDF